MKALLFLSLLLYSYGQDLAPIYNQKAVENLPNGSFHLNAGFIYAKASIDNNSLGFETNLLGINSGGTSFDYRGSLKDLHFSYEPGLFLQWGFRIDGNLGLDFDANYVRYRSTAFSRSDSAQILLPTISTNQVAQVVSIADATDQFFLRRGDGKWIFGLDILNAGVSCPFFQGTRLIVSPFIYLKNMWLRQRRYFHFSFVDPSGFTQEIKNKVLSWGIGPNIGTRVEWIFFRYVSLFANSAASLLCTRYSMLDAYNEASGSLVSQATQGESPHISLSYRQKSLSYLRTTLDLDLGVKAGGYLDNQKYHLEFAASYWFTVLFNQNMFRFFQDGISLAMGRSPHGDVYLEGLNCTLRLDY